MKRLLLLSYLIICVTIFSFSQEQMHNAETESEEEAEKEQKHAQGDFWIGPSFDLAMYTSNGVNIGGGISFGYGKGASIGIKMTYLSDNEFYYDIFELMFLLRFYFFGRDYCSGPFIQFTGGQSLFFRQKEILIPANWGTFTGGLNFGWRIHLGRIYYIEPVLCAGYPYFLGFNLSAGVHF